MKAHTVALSHLLSTLLIALPVLANAPTSEQAVVKPAVVEITHRTAHGDIILQFEASRPAGTESLLRLDGAGFLPGAPREEHPEIRATVDINTSSLEDWSTLLASDAGFVSTHPKLGLRIVITEGAGQFLIKNAQGTNTAVVSFSGDWDDSFPELDEQERTLLAIGAGVECDPTLMECLETAQMACTNGVMSLSYRCNVKNGEVECEFDCFPAP